MKTTPTTPTTLTHDAAVDGLRALMAAHRAEEDAALAGLLALMAAHRTAEAAAARHDAPARTPVTDPEELAVWMLGQRGGAQRVQRRTPVDVNPAWPA